jgi:hypothetical protein
MPGEFATLVSEDRFDDFFTNLRNMRGKGKPTDILTPSHPIYKQLEKKGRVVPGEPGPRPFHDILYDTPHNEVVLSRTGDQLKQIDETTVEVTTRAEYDWMMFLGHLVVPKFEYDNLSAEGMTRYLENKLDAVEQGAINTMINRVWNGYTHASDHIYGLAEAVRTGITTDPTRGAIGNVSITKHPTWVNKARAHGAAYKTVGGGGQITANFLMNLGKVYRDCSNNVQGAAPDLIATNDIGCDFVEDLVSLQKMFPDEKATYELGVDAYKFKGANIYYDPDMPVDNTAEATFRLLNTSSFRLEKARGLMNKWSKMTPLEAKTGFRAGRSDQWTMVYENLRLNGILYDVRAS